MCFQTYGLIWTRKHEIIISWKCFVNTDDTDVSKYSSNWDFKDGQLETWIGSMSWLSGEIQWRLSLLLFKIGLLLFLSPICTFQHSNLWEEVISSQINFLGSIQVGWQLYPHFCSSAITCGNAQYFTFALLHLPTILQTGRSMLVGHVLTVHPQMW